MYARCTVRGDDIDKALKYLERMWVRLWNKKIVGMDAKTVSPLWYARAFNYGITSGLIGE